MTVDKELTEFVNKALGAVPSLKTQKRSKRFVKRWRWVGREKGEGK